MIRRTTAEIFIPTCQFIYVALFHDKKYCHKISRYLKIYSSTLKPDFSAFQVQYFSNFN